MAMVASGFALTLAASTAHGAKECGLDAAGVFERGGPSAVQIVALTTDPFSASNRARWIQGSGIVVDETGLVLTSSHVVHGSPEILAWLDEPELHLKAEIASKPARKGSSACPAPLQADMIGVKTWKILHPGTT